MSLLFDEDIESDLLPDKQLCTKEDHALTIENEFFGLNEAQTGPHKYRSCSKISVFRRNSFTDFYNLDKLHLSVFKFTLHMATKGHSIIVKMPHDFRRDYGTTMVIVDCLELKVQVPSSSQMQSKTFSDSHEIMFISLLYTSRISDKEICHRSGFFSLLQQKLNSGELLPADAVMADKGFLIQRELEEMGLCLNIPPLLRDKIRFSPLENIQTHNCTA